MTTEEMRSLQNVKVARDGLTHAALKAAGILMAGFVAASAVFVAGYVALGKSPLKAVFDPPEA